MQMKLLGASLHHLLESRSDNRNLNFTSSNSTREEKGSIQEEKKKEDTAKEEMEKEKEEEGETRKAKESKVKKEQEKEETRKKQHDELMSQLNFIIFVLFMIQIFIIIK